DTSCATVNGDPNATGAKTPNFQVTPPWPGEYKNGTGTMDTPQFVEMGVDLSSFGLDEGCYNTFVPDTRSSASPTATLFDYAISAFHTCTTTTTTVPSTGAS